MAHILRAMALDADAIVVGAGLAGLVATAELADAGRRVVLLDQEPEASLGGQAHWSFGGLFLVDSPEQRRARVRDSRELALDDWLGAAGFDRDEDVWPRRWAEAYVDFAAGEKRPWLHGQGVRWLPLVQWAERGGYGGFGHGNFEPRAQATVVTSGGIGGDHDLVRRSWPERLGEPPSDMLSGVPDHVDGRMLATVSEAGGRVLGSDRMWHYPEGVRNPASIWTRHGIRILSGPSPLWLDARGRRLPVPLFPGFDALGAVEHIVKGGHAHSWFVLNERILATEFALSGSE